MEIAELTQWLTTEGFTVSRIGDDIEIRGPLDKLTPQLRATLRDQKPELLEQLGGEKKKKKKKRWRSAKAHHQAEMAKHVEHLWDTHAVCDAGRPVCDRCGDAQYFDVPIHDGKSTRRDCANCGVTICFPKWYGKQDTKA